MCGIAGIHNSVEISEVAKNRLHRMCNFMRMRGPDHTGKWADESKQVYLGHTRLSIIDLSSMSNQPMNSVCGRYTIVFNGEIYNYKEIQKSLVASGVFFKTKSDTEVVLSAYIKYGINSFKMLRGMFAFAIYDNHKSRIVAVRDPYGIKPLYYAAIGGSFYFASQVKAIVAGCYDTQFSVNSESQFMFRLFGNTPAPNTYLNQINQVPAGGYIEYHLDNKVDEFKYINLSDFWIQEKNCPEDLSKIVKDAVFDSISQHLVADVPVGIFLSGGIDSAVIAGVLNEQGRNGTIGITIAYDEFKGTASDELYDAESVADKYSLIHYKRKVAFCEFESELNNIIYCMDQPTIDGVNTWFASKAASEAGLKVALSGVGGDELFLGYRHHSTIPFALTALRLLKKIGISSEIISILLNELSLKGNKNKWSNFSHYSSNVLMLWILARSLQLPENEIQRKFMLNSKMLSNLEDEIMLSNGVNGKDIYSQISNVESFLYLKNQLLKDSDWASMSNSIELRTPFVDIFLIQKLGKYISYFSEYKSKSLLANILRKKLPNNIIYKRKTGFGIPVNEWMTRIVGQKFTTLDWADFVSEGYMKSIQDVQRVKYD